MQMSRSHSIRLFWLALITSAAVTVPVFAGVGGAKIQRQTGVYTVVSALEPASASRQRLQRILARSEFDWEKKSTWWSRLWRRITDWWWRLFYGGIVRKGGRWIFYGIMGLGAALLLFFMLRVLLHKPRAAGRSEAGKDASARGHGARRQEEWWRGQAEKAVRAGRLREALRCLYMALLHSLDKAGLIRLAQAKTNWDYRREIRDSRQGPIRAFDAFTALYERKWYGLEDCNQAEYAQAVSLYDEARGVSR